MAEQSAKTEKHADTMIQIIEENMKLKNQIQEMHDLIIKTNLVTQNKVQEMIADFRHELGIDVNDEIKEYEEEVNKMTPKEKAAHEKEVKKGSAIAKKLRLKGKPPS